MNLNSAVHQYQDLIYLFNRCFSTEYNTRLIRGENEPLYLPADDHRSYHAIFFAHGFYSSALHECAHWLIAGEARRKQIDFGYWYEPDGRTPEQQTLFQQVEIKPQAIEWILSMAAGYRFQLSIDNLNGQPMDTTAFMESIYQQVLTYCHNGLPKRAQQFRQALCNFYNTPTVLEPAPFSAAMHKQRS